jgi:hypothetical protein
MTKKTINKLYTLLEQNGLTYSYTPGVADVTIVTNVTWVSDPKNRRHLDVHAVPNTTDGKQKIGRDTFWGTVIVPNRG